MNALLMKNRYAFNISLIKNFPACVRGSAVLFYRLPDLVTRVLF